MAENNKWILCEDRLPEYKYFHGTWKESDQVLVWAKLKDQINDRGGCAVAELCDDDGCEYWHGVYDSIWEITECDVIAWMPLPDTPAKK